MIAWRQQKRSEKPKSSTLGEYTFSSRKKYDPSKLMKEATAAVPAVHAIEVEKNRITFKSKMPRNDVDRTELEKVIRRHSRRS